MSVTGAASRWIRGLRLTCRTPSLAGDTAAGRAVGARRRNRLEPRVTRLAVVMAWGSPPSRRPSMLEPLVEPQSRRAMPSGPTASSAWMRERSGSSTTRSASPARPMRSVPAQTSKERPESGRRRQPVTAQTCARRRRRRVRHPGRAAHRQDGTVHERPAADRLRPAEPAPADADATEGLDAEHPRSAGSRSAAVAPGAHSTSTSSGSLAVSTRTTVICRRMAVTLGRARWAGAGFSAGCGQPRLVHRGVDSPRLRAAPGCGAEAPVPARGRHGSLSARRC